MKLTRDPYLVMEILEGSGLGLPQYYEWRSRSGCTFCFFQQKIEWVRLSERHPDRFEEAQAYEKTALKNGSPKPISLSRFAAPGGNCRSVTSADADGTTVTAWVRASHGTLR